MRVIAATERGLRRWADFGARSGRAEFWNFGLGVALVVALLIGLDVVIFGRDYAFGLADLWALAMLVPMVSALVRRLHDIDRGGWWALLLLLPVAGALILLIWAAKPGDEGANRFGPPPRALV